MGDSSSAVPGSKGELFNSFTHSVQIFKDATLFFSHDGVPNIATIIPAMDHIDEVLATNALDAQYSLSIHTGEEDPQLLLQQNRSF